MTCCKTLQITVGPAPITYRYAIENYTPFNTGALVPFTFGGLPLPAAWGGLWHPENHKTNLGANQAYEALDIYSPPGTYVSSVNLSMGAFWISETWLFQSANPAFLNWLSIKVAASDGAGGWVSSQVGWWRKVNDGNLHGVYSVVNIGQTDLTPTVTVLLGTE